MTADVLEHGIGRRIALRFAPQVVRASIPAGCIGTYYLFTEDGRLVYVGRSDNCVRARLSRHEHLPDADYFIWDPLTSRDAAFIKEAWWFHEMEKGSGTLNVIHPAKPAGSILTCPFCNERDATALSRALEPRGSPGAAPLTTTHVHVKMQGDAT